MNNYSNITEARFEFPRSNRALGIIPVVGLILFVIGIASSLLIFVETREAIALALLAVFLFVIVILFPKGSILLLPFLGALSGWPVQISGVNVRLDQALGVILLIPLLLNLLIGKTRWRRSSINTFIYFFIIVNIFSSLISQDPKSSLFQVVNLSSAMIIYFVVFNLIQTKREYKRFFNVMLIAGFCAMLYGLLLFILGMLGFNVHGANIVEDVAIWGIYGSMREPNIFGSYSASMLLIGITLLATGSMEFKRYRKYMIIFIIIAGIAVLLSYARGAWIGTACGLIFLFMHRKHGLRFFSIRAMTVIVLASFIMFYIFSSRLIPSEMYEYKVTNLLNFNEGTGYARAITWGKAWSNFLSRPLLGNGTYSYSYLDPEDAVINKGFEAKAWIGNLLLLTLHDTGIVGMIVLAGLLWSIFRETATTIRSRNNSIFKFHAIAYQAAFVALLVAYQATSAFSLGFTWILVGMVSLARVHHGKESD